MRAYQVERMGMLALFAVTIMQTTSQPAGAAQGGAADRPNIILIVTDDQGYGDFGATGNPHIETPHLDAMAKRSATMTTFYVSPVCSPTRASLMTGRFNYRTRVIDTWVGRSMMEPEELTVAEALRAGGYATGIFGKWHLGDCYPMRPSDQGFDESLILRGGGLAQPSDPPENERRYTNPILFHNNQQVQTKGYCTDVYFDAALAFARAKHEANQPFFAYIATNAPHGPWHDVPADHLAKYQAKADQLRELLTGSRDATMVDHLVRGAAMIGNIDDNVGKLFAKLDELGITDNTLVIFMTDNGPDSLRYAGPFRGRKGQVYEGGVRTVLWMHWPARLKPGTESDAVAAHIDVMPTLLEAAGVEQPEDLKLDGRSFLGLLTGESTDWPQRDIVLQWHRGDEPARYHNFMLRRGKWKLLHNTAVNEPFRGEPRFELYDVVADPGEKNNLAAAQPALVKQLREGYDAWFDDVSSTREDNYAPPRIHIGADRAPTTVLTRQDWRGGTWDRNSLGQWLVHIEATAAYNLVVRFPEAMAAEAITLYVNDRERAASAVDVGETEFTFSNIPLDSGDATIRIELETESGATRGPHQVEVTLSDDEGVTR